MSAMTNYLENLIVDILFRARTFSKPANLFVGLASAAADQEVPTITELSGGSYARVQIAVADATWNGTHGSTTGNSSGTDGAIDNAIAITFPAPTADWGQATHWLIADAASGGNVWIVRPLTTPKTINNGDPAPSFAAGDLVITAA